MGPRESRRHAIVSNSRVVADAARSSWILLRGRSNVFNASRGSERHGYGGAISDWRARSSFAGQADSGEVARQCDDAEHLSFFDIGRFDPAKPGSERDQMA